MKNDLFLRKSDILLDALYPKQCVCCNAIIENGEEICDSCLRELERVDPNKRCMKCGLEKSNCRCGIYVYHFEACVAPFFNSTAARRGMYAFKFKRRPHYGIFFAREMAKTVAAEYSEIGFDAVTYVPLSKKSLCRRGFNQTLVLAEGISNIIGIPLLKDTLFSKSTLKSQHRLGKSARFKRVHNLYGFNEQVSKQLKNKTVLLVDDIKTTGATLDECARQLLFAGAERVYAVTALITDMKPKNGDKKSGKKRYNPEKTLNRFGNNL